MKRIILSVTDRIHAALELAGKMDEQDPAGFLETHLLLASKGVDMPLAPLLQVIVLPPGAKDPNQPDLFPGPADVAAPPAPVATT